MLTEQDMEKWAANQADRNDNNMNLNRKLKKVKHAHLLVKLLIRFKVIPNWWD